MLLCYSPDVVLDVSRIPHTGLIGAASARGIYTGHEGLRDWFRAWYEPWEDLDEHLEELFDAGEHVISFVTQRGRGRLSGVDVELHQIAGVWTVAAGKVMRVAWLPTRQEALNAAQLPL